MTQIDAAERLRRRTESRVRRFMEGASLGPADGRLLVAVSGGPDSSALLAVLSRLARRSGLQLTAAYFDHGLRGEAAAGEEREAVGRLCSTLGVPVIAGAGDVRAESQRTKRSIEDAARRLRYAFLADAAREAGCSMVATGHTASDQAETVLLNLVRGAGLAGIAGIAPNAPWPFPEQPGDLSVTRPLLCLSRDDTVAYCAAAGIVPVEDESNASAAYRRNRVRHEVLPLLRTLNPRVDEALVRLGGAAARASAHLEGEAERLIDASRAGEVRVSRKLFPIFLPSMRDETVRRALRSVAGDLEGFSARHIEAVEKLALSGRTGDRLDLPRGVAAHLTHEAIVFSAGSVEIQALPEGVATLPVPGEARFGGLTVSAGQEAAAGAVCTTVDAVAVGTALVVRRRRPGDRMQPLGMSGTKKLQDIFVDARVPREQRDAVPVFENERGIVWTGGLRVAEWARAREGEPTVTLSYRAVE